MVGVIIKKGHLLRRECRLQLFDRGISLLLLYRTSNRHWVVFAVPFKADCRIGGPMLDVAASRFKDGNTLNRSVTGPLPDGRRSDRSSDRAGRVPAPWFFTVGSFLDWPLTESYSWPRRRSHLGGSPIAHLIVSCANAGHRHGVT